MITKGNSVKALQSTESVGQIWMIDEGDLFDMLELKGKEYYPSL